MTFSKLMTYLQSFILLVILVTGLGNSQTGLANSEDIFDYLPSGNQGAIRKDKAVAIGLGLTGPYNFPGHYQYRFSPKFAVGVDYAGRDTLESPGYLGDLEVGERSNDCLTG